MTRGSPPQTCAAAITQTDVFLSLQEAAAAATGGQHRSDLTWCNTSTFLPHFFLGPKLEIFRRRGGLIFSASGPDNDVPFIRLAPLAGFLFFVHWKKKGAVSWEDFVYFCFRRMVRPVTVRIFGGCAFHLAPPIGHLAQKKNGRRLVCFRKRATDSTAA